jgi:hypothetical protein
MATLYISEYATAALEGAGQVVPCGSEPAILTQTVPIGGSSQVSNPFNAATHFVRVHCDTICSVAFSFGAAVATLTSARLGAGQTEFFGVQPGMTVAVIQNV